jgi:interferon gamma-inducible protein 30
MDLTPFPYGNAKRSSSGHITCQHGSAECIGKTRQYFSLTRHHSHFFTAGNLNLNCLIHEASNVTANYWPSWACIEGSEDPIKDAANCCTDHGISWRNVNACASGDLGNSLVLAAAYATEALSPPHKYVPWVTVNGAPLGEDDLDNIVSIVCNAYQGPTKPDICNA